VTVGTREDFSERSLEKRGAAAFHGLSTTIDGVEDEGLAGPPTLRTGDLSKPERSAGQPAGIKGFALLPDHHGVRPLGGALAPTTKPQP